MGKLRALRWLSLVGLLMVFWLAPGANATSYEIVNPSSSYGNLKATDLGSEGSYYLGPIAAVNSFIYLQNRYSAIYHNNLVTDPVVAAMTLAGPNYMNTQIFFGTQVPDFYWGQYHYVEDRVPGKTIYAGETTPQTWGSRGRPSWVTERNSGPSWQFLYNELSKGADVEILLAVSGVGIYVTLTGFHFDDANTDNLINNGETAWITYIDPTTGGGRTSNIWNNGDSLETTYETNCFITMAASERPVPLPSTLLLFASGMLGIWSWKRKK